MPAAATYSLTLWALQGKHGGDGYGFPFDRPLLDFAARLLELYSRLPDLLDLLLNHDEPCENQAIWKLALEGSFVGNDRYFVVLSPQSGAQGTSTSILIVSVPLKTV